ncbi:hypothetical protein [Aliamphritea spongicola]|nr:hypothetical protein [Aliamphritea spongicola]
MLNWALYESCFSTLHMRQIWSEEAMLSAWLKVEQTLACCQADQGLIPPAVAEQLAEISACQLNEQTLQDKMQLVGRPIVGLVEQLRHLLGPDHAPMCTIWPPHRTSWIPPPCCRYSGALLKSSCSLKPY